MRLGSRLRAHRELREVSVRELARRVGVSPSAVSQIERGKSSPRLETLCALVRELGISFDDLFPVSDPQLHPAIPPTPSAPQRI